MEQDSFALKKPSTAAMPAICTKDFALKTMLTPCFNEEWSYCYYAASNM
jgi:hypothetical protein